MSTPLGKMSPIPSPEIPSFGSSPQLDRSGLWPQLLPTTTNLLPGPSIDPLKADQCLYLRDVPNQPGQARLIIFNPTASRCLASDLLKRRDMSCTPVAKRVRNDVAHPSTSTEPIDDVGCRLDTRITDTNFRTRHHCQAFVQEKLRSIATDMIVFGQSNGAILSTLGDRTVTQPDDRIRSWFGEIGVINDIISNHEDRIKDHYKQSQQAFTNQFVSSMHDIAKAVTDLKDMLPLQLQGPDRPRFPQEDSTEADQIIAIEEDEL